MSFKQDDCAVYTAIFANQTPVELLFDIKANGFDLLTGIYAILAGVKYAIVKAHNSYHKTKVNKAILYKRISLILDNTIFDSVSPSST